MDEHIKLVRQAKKGSVDAFAKLYEEIYEDMYKFALYTLRNTYDAEDVVSEAVTSAFASIKKLRLDEAFKGWIFRILSNKCNEKLKEYTKRNSKEEGQTVSEMEEMQIFSGGTMKDDIAERVSMQGLFWELAEEECMIIGMHLFGGYKTKEIAEILHMNENTVRSKESRALKKLAEKLEG